MMSERDSSEESPKKMKKIDNRFKEYKQKYILTSSWRGLVDAKLDGAKPYYFFLTRIENSPNTYNEDLSITFPELLDKSLGTLEHSIHINFMVELPWLLAQYAVNDLINPSMTILYDADDDDLRRIPSHLNVKAIKVKSPYPFGHHHTKMSVFFYTDKSVRFAVYTANLIESDWENRTQGVWVSPKCPYLGDNVPINYGETDTLFKVDVLRYLNSYRLVEIYEWLVRIQKSNCSSIRVCFVASIPGDHEDDSFGHKKLSKLIKENCLSSETLSWDLIAQCSSIGESLKLKEVPRKETFVEKNTPTPEMLAIRRQNRSLGPNPKSWLCGEFARSLQQSPVPATSPVNVIYPSVENVAQSHDGMYGGACLPYCSRTHFKQIWLNEYLKQWKSDHRYRSKAVPHIKSYTKLSPEGNRIAWFLLTSANLSKAAWGRFAKVGLLKILSYEAGVLFLPRFLVASAQTGKDSFTVKRGGDSQANDERFPLPYDTPLTPYSSTDKIFLYDKCFPR